jgi:CRISPR type III-B/RAMP module-associated protein Cmr5
MPTASDHAKTLDQKRTRHAAGWKFKSDVKKLKSIADSLPGMIMINGLLPALSFLQGKETQHQEIARALGDWLLNCETIPWAQRDPNADILEALCDNDSFTYRAATAEAIVYAGFLKRVLRARAGE